MQYSYLQSSHRGLGMLNSHAMTFSQIISFSAFPDSKKVHDILQSYHRKQGFNEKIGNQSAPKMLEKVPS